MTNQLETFTLHHSKCANCDEFCVFPSRFGRNVKRPHSVLFGLVMVVYTYNSVPFSRSHVRATQNELDVFSRTPSEASFIAKCTKKQASLCRPRIGSPSFHESRDGQQNNLDYGARSFESEYLIILRHSQSVVLMAKALDFQEVFSICTIMINRDVVSFFRLN